MTPGKPVPPGPPKVTKAIGVLATGPVPRLANLVALLLWGRWRLSRRPATRGAQP